MMLVPSVKYDLDLKAASELLDFTMIRCCDEMIEFLHDDIKLTLYSNGSLMFYHFIDIERGYSIADEVLETISSNSCAP